MSAELAIQKAIRDSLINSAALTALVPADNILDRNDRPSLDRSIIIGEGQSVDDGAIARNRLRVYTDLHIWKREESTTGSKMIASVIRVAIGIRRPALDAGFHCADWFISSSRFMRDPAGEFSHGVVTVEALVGEQS